MLDIFTSPQKIAKNLRIYNTRPMILFYYLGLVLTGNFGAEKEVFLVPIIFILVYSSVSLTNYLIDKKTDEFNKRPNPFKGVKVDRYESFLVFIPALAALFLSLLTHNPALTTAFVLLFLILSFLYSSAQIKASYRAFPKFIIMSAGYCLLPGIFGLLSGHPTHYDYFFIFAISLFFSSYLPYSDIKDIEGDKIVGKNTLVVKYGINNLPFFGLAISLIGFAINIGLGSYKTNFAVVIAFIFLSGHLSLIIFPKLLLSKKLYNTVGYFLYILLLFLIFSLS